MNKFTRNLVLFGGSTLIAFTSAVAGSILIPNHLEDRFNKEV